MQHQGTLNKALRRIIRDCNESILERLDKEKELVLLLRFSCHILRHTFTTRLCESGVNMKVIQDILGHSNLATTADIYSHISESAKENAMRQLEAVYTRQDKLEQNVN